MITIQTLQFNYWFSYGKDNNISLSQEPLTQVKGKNGGGKSSLILILQEVYYGKNIKNIKKQDLINRKFPTETLWAKSTFMEGKDLYSIELTRKTNVKIILKKNGKDISSHTSTNTYKTIENILGMDFKTFSQLTYQSSLSSLQFLGATDTNRKNFLVSLFNLMKYTEMYDTFKDESRKLTKLVSEQDGKIETISAWVREHEKIPLDEKFEKEVPEVPQELNQEIIKINHELLNIVEINKKISDNNAYIDMREAIDMDMLTNTVEKLDDNNIKQNAVEKSQQIRQLKCDIDEARLKIKNYKNEIEKYEDIPETCDNCGQAWPEEKNEEKIIELIDKKGKIEHLINVMLDELTKRKDELIEIENLKIVLRENNEQFEKCKKAKEEFERLSTLIDNSIDTEVLDKAELETKKSMIQDDINLINAERKKVINYNTTVAAHNSKVSVIKDQLKEYNSSLEKEFEILGDSEDKLDKVDILKKAFSTTGLITYKLEFLVKDLESEINQYLAVFSDGMFQIEFNLKGEKLNVDIINNGKTVTIESLSEGERSRVNVSTLLAIRKMMSQLSSTKINLLFLDEIMGVLDLEGKDTLIDVLLKENLNTYLVSHEYEHPLVPSFTVIKENEESRIE